MGGIVADEPQETRRRRRQRYLNRTRNGHGNLCLVFAGQNIEVTQVGDRIWLVSFMQYDLDYCDDEACRLGPKVLLMSPE